MLSAPPPASIVAPDVALPPRTVSALLVSSKNSMFSKLPVSPSESAKVPDSLPVMVTVNASSASAPERVSRSSPPLPPKIVSVPNPTPNVSASSPP